MNFEVVVAIDRERGIGRDNRLPWKLPTDMAHFVNTTRQAPAGQTNAVIMGRKTWDSIPPKYRPLDQRTNIVVSRNRELALPAGVRLAHGLSDALEQSRGAHRCFVIGGAELYGLALLSPLCKVVHLTVIDATFDCDAFFPQLPQRFVLRETSAPVVENGISFTFQQWVC